jgi:MFS family permease
MISHAGEEVGRGRAFGLNESLDAAGATVGPLIVALVLAERGNYRIGFAVLLVTGLLCLGTLIATQRTYPNPEKFEPSADGQASDLPRAYWLYLAGGAMIGFGFADVSRTTCFATSLLFRKERSPDFSALTAEHRVQKTSTISAAPSGKLTVVNSNVIIFDRGKS